MLPLGTEAPDFELPDPSGREHSLDEIVEGKAGVLVAFISNHCPYVKHIAPVLAERGREWQEKGVAVVAIGANDVDNYPDDSPEAMAREIEARGYTFPYLYDESQEVARSYRAACTPDFFLFDADRRLVYRGQFDSSRPRNGQAANGEDLDAAVGALLAGSQIPEEDQVPSMGCNIKWKPGNEPAA
jgi:peroxiredoxin